MYLSADKVEEAFRKLSEVARHGNLDCVQQNRIPVSVEDVITVTAEVTGYSIEKYLVDFEGRHVRGEIEKYKKEKRAVIYIRKEQDEADRRFATVKEAMQLIIDEQEDCNPYGEQTIDALVADAYFGPGDGNKEPADEHLQSEMIAEWAALEVMYPYEVRLVDEQSIKGGETSINALALNYELPAEIVAKALHSRYMAIASEVWSRLQKLK